MQNTLPPMHLDGRRQKENRMAMHQPSRLRQEILPQLADHRRKHIAKGCYDGNHGNRQPKHRGAANTETAYRYGIRGRKER